MRGSSAAPLPILRQIFLCVVDSHRAVRYGGNHLPQRLGAHVARGEHAGKIRAGGFVRHNIAGLVQRQFTSEQLRRRSASHADEHAVAGKLTLRAGVSFVLKLCYKIKLIYPLSKPPKVLFEHRLTL